MFAREIMTAQPALVTTEDSLTRAAELMRDQDVGMLPVVDERQHLVGVITDRDIVLRHVAAGHTNDMKVGEHMTREPLVSVRASSSVDEVADKMSHFQLRRIPVVDDDMRVVGIVAQADLAVRTGPDDASLVGHVVGAISQPDALVH